MFGVAVSQKSTVFIRPDLGRVETIERWIKDRKGPSTEVIVARRGDAFESYIEDSEEPKQRRGSFDLVLAPLLYAEQQYFSALFALTEATPATIAAAARLGGFEIQELPAED